MTETNPADQAPAQSVTDIIAAKFGITADQPENPERYDGAPYETAQEPEEEAPEDASEPESEVVEIEYEGERFAIPKKLEKAIMQERDYTQKSQSVAEQRRQVEFQRKALEAARIEREFTESVAAEQQQLALMDNYLAQLKSVNTADLPMEDGFKHWMQLQQIKEQREALSQSIEGKRNEYTKRARQAVEQLKAESRELLTKQIPNFSDATLKELNDYAQSVGYSAEDIEMFQLDPRATSVLHKARLYDQLQANKATAVQKAASPVVKPGASNPMPQDVRQKLAFNKAMKSAKTSQEKARLIEQRLAGRF